MEAARGGFARSLRVQAKVAIVVHWQFVLLLGSLRCSWDAQLAGWPGQVCLNTSLPHAPPSLLLVTAHPPKQKVLLLTAALSYGAGTVQSECCAGSALWPEAPHPIAWQGWASHAAEKSCLMHMLLGPSWWVSLQCSLWAMPCGCSLRLCIPVVWNMDWLCGVVACRRAVPPGVCLLGCPAVCQPSCITGAVPYPWGDSCRHAREVDAASRRMHTGPQACCG